MKIAHTGRMNQTATYWAPCHLDGYGQPRPGNCPEPVTIKVRWEDRQELMRDPEGREFRSQAVVYPAEMVSRGGWLAKGDHTDTQDPQDVNGAFEVRDVRCTPSLRGDKYEVKTWL